MKALVVVRAPRWRQPYSTHIGAEIFFGIMAASERTKPIDLEGGKAMGKVEGHPVGDRSVQRSDDPFAAT